MGSLASPASEGDGLHSPQEEDHSLNRALVGIPLSHDLEATTTGKSEEYEPSGTWFHAAFHTVTAVVGVGVLGLPYAFSYLGWFFGLLLLVGTAAVSLYTSHLLAHMHEDECGTRHCRYQDLGKAVFGKRWGAWAIVPSQFSVMIGLAVTYTVTAGQSLQAIHDTDCNDHISTSSEGREGRACRAAFCGWVLLFGALQLALSQIRNFDDLWWVSLLGATMSAMYSTIAFVASAASGRSSTADYSLRPGTTADQVFGIMNSLGTIMFAYGGHAVLLEIQATLAAPPKVAHSMMKGVYAAYVVVCLAYFPVAIAGFAAFGNAVYPDVLLSVENPSWLISLANFMVVIHIAASYQVFSQPVFEVIESSIADGGWRLADRPHLMRGIVRSLYVLGTTIVALLLPFFADLMGFIGATGFTPMTFILPSILYIKSERPTGFKLWLNVVIVAVFVILGLLAGVGSVRQIAVHAKNYHILAI
ncbi:hypothetical protein WJX72_007252 [[Myrmecia] bisecta]|uniref:Amino acid transporter transmembrane domain-containing protein n=1 Tax=[Myrmecia] bisecta TaxID=41462 RepID=A0AAW1PPN6_9CHLO